MDTDTFITCCGMWTGVFISGTTQTKNILASGVPPQDWKHSIIILHIAVVMAQLVSSDSTVLLTHACSHVSM